MSMTPSIYQYQSYRKFISDWLKQKKFTYRGFAAQYSRYISFIALAKMLAKGKQGKERANYRMAPETIARLGKVMQLSDNELIHLILLRLENDSEVLSGQYGTAYRRAMRQLIKERENLAKHQGLPGLAKSNRQKSGSEISQLVFEIFELFPPNFQQHCLEEIIFQGRSYAARQAGRPGVKALHTVLTRLENLRDFS